MKKRPNIHKTRSRKKREKEKKLRGVLEKESGAVYFSHHYPAVKATPKRS